MHKILIVFVLLALAACVKDESVSTAGKVGTSTGTTGGGASNGVDTKVEDPLAAHAWHLKNYRQKSFSLSKGVMGKDINLENVHNTYKILGRNIRIAVSDSGVEIDHQDLFGNTLPDEHRNYTFQTPSSWTNSIPLPSDDNAHGTAVAGLISALGWNGIGSRGIAPESKFAAFRYIFNDPSTGASRLAKELDQYQGNFDIFNYSYGHKGYLFVPDALLTLKAVELGAKTLRNSKGAVYIQASGNNFDASYDLCDADLDPTCTISASGNTNVHEGLSSPYKIVVGAVNASGEKSTYSTPGSSIWVSAPGGEDGILYPAMITTDISGCSAGYSFRDENYSEFFDFGFLPLNLRCDYTSRMNGTSAATPIVSGVVALMLEANPNLTWRDVKHILALTSNRVDYTGPQEILPHPHSLNYFGAGYVYDYKWTKNAANRWFSNWYGFGMVDAEAAVTMSMNYNLSTLGTFEETKVSDTWFYNSGSINEVIDDESPIPAQSSIWVGHNYIIEAVRVQLTTDHTWPGDLAIHLVSPSGTESRLLTLNNHIYAQELEANFTMATNAFYEEESKGLWTLKVYDGSAGDTGKLINWKILISGHKKSSELLNPDPPTFLAMSGTANPATETPQFSFSASNQLVSYYEAAIGSSPYLEDIRSWTSIGTSTSSQKLTGLNLSSGVQYYLKIRARSGNYVSNPQIIPWTPSF